MNKIITTLYNAVTDINRASAALYAMPETAHEPHQRFPTTFRQF